MTVLQKVAQVSSSLEASGRMREFGAICKMIARSKGTLNDAVFLAENDKLSPRIIGALRERSAQSALDPTNASALAQYSNIIDAALASLRNIGVFDAMLPSMMQLPRLHSRAVVVVVGATGSETAPGAPKLLSQMDLDGTTSDLIKVVTLIAVTEELLRIGGPAASGLLSRELLRATALQTDVAFLSRLTSGVSPVTTNGSDAVSIRADIAGALASLALDTSSKVFILVESKSAKHWCAQVTSTGAAAFPEMGPLGGRVCNLPVLVSDALAENTFVVVDAAQIAGNSGTIDLSSARNATLQYESSPDSPPTGTTIMRPLFQVGEVALRGERYFTALRMRSTAVAIVSDLSYSGDSPS